MSEHHVPGRTAPEFSLLPRRARRIPLVMLAAMIAVSTPVLAQDTE